MALTINSKPTTHTPAFNHQTFVISSTNSAQTNFSYQCSVVMSATNTSAASGSITDELAPRPDNSKAYYNPQRTIESYCHNEFYPTITDFQFSLNGAITEITYTIYEKYGTPATTQGTPATGTYYVWNAAYQAPDFVDFTYAAGVYAKDLTLAPSLTETISYNQKFLFKSWNIGFSTRTLYRMTIVSYSGLNATGSILQNCIIENQYATISTYKRNYIIFNASPTGINNFTGSITYQLNVGALIPATTKSYQFYFQDGASPPNQSSNLNLVNIEEGCEKYSRYVLHFLNRMGNYDSFTFNKVSRKLAEKKDSTYKRLVFEGANPPGYYKYSKDEFNYTTVVTNKMILNSDWITDVQATWLKDLIMSPDVFLEDSSNVLYSVKVTDKNYETKMKVNDKLSNITINIEYTLEDIRQRG